MKKSCAICGKDVLRGQGLYYGGRLIHKSCKAVAKIQRYRLNADGGLWELDEKESLKWLRHKRRAVAYEIMFIFITLSLSAIFYIVLDGVVSYFETYISTYYSSVYDTNYYTFITQFWYWYPIICVLFGLVIWGVVGGQQRSQMPY